MKLRDLEKDTKLLNLTFELSGFQPPINFSLIYFATVISGCFRGVSHACYAKPCNVNTEHPSIILHMLTDHGTGLCIS